MAIWPFRSKRPSPPPLQDEALSDLSHMFISDPQDPTPGGDILDPSRFDFSVESLAAMDEHLGRMRGRALQGQDLFKFVLRAGAYVGEVIRRHAPPQTRWHWLKFEDAVSIDPGLKSFGGGLGTVAVLWDGADWFTFPLNKVGKYLENGPEDSVRMFAQVILADSARPQSS
jgi:hypothetical protein